MTSYGNKVDNLIDLTQEIYGNMKCVELFVSLNVFSLDVCKRLGWTVHYMII
jgi:hypothetical protein